MKNKPKILLMGGGGHCRSVIDVIEQEGRFEISGIIDKRELIGSKILGYDVIGCDDDLEKLSNIYKYALVTVGHIRSNSIRIKLFDILKEIGYIVPSIISPLAYVSKYASIDDGTIVMHHALINANAKIGKNCIINTKALIEHDSRVEDSCHISTGAIVNGGVLIKKNSFIGSNATTKEYIEVGRFIKAGEVVR